LTDDLPGAGRALYLDDALVFRSGGDGAIEGIPEIGRVLGSREAGVRVTFDGTRSQLRELLRRHIAQRTLRVTGDYIEGVLDAYCE